MAEIELFLRHQDDYLPGGIWTGLGLRTGYKKKPGSSDFCMGTPHMLC